MPDPGIQEGPGDRTGDLKRAFFRFAAGGVLPARWFVGRPPRADELTARSGRLTLEIVSHCWKYAHLLAYQLSSLALHAPRNLDVRMTVFHGEEDADTVALLRAFSQREVAGVTWDWRPLPRTALMRRCIGRNLAALSTQADWIWFTDCDLLFQPGCLDALAAQLQGRRDALVYPREEHRTALLPASDEALKRDIDHGQLLNIDDQRFRVRRMSRATGPLQITHGDAARRMGYCNGIDCYLEPAETWQKAHEDRVFRWVLGTQGTPIDLPGVFRIRHLEKGRYTGSRWSNWLRGSIRRLKSPT